MANDIGARIEGLLGELTVGRERDTAEQLVGLLVQTYGGALGRVVALLRDRAPDLLTELAEDELVESLLLVHDLHPLDTDTRVQRALDRVRPYLGSHAGGVTYLGVDDAGVAQLRLEGNCHGCPSSTQTVQMAIEGALLDGAPELTGVEVAGMTVPEAPAAPLLQIGTGPPPGWYPEPGWATLPELGPPTRKPITLDVEGVPVLLCSVRGTLYAYRDTCAACGNRFAESTVEGSVLACAACGATFDVRLAGKGVRDPDRHLDPLPLLADSQGVRVALPRAVAS